ncbi:unnamed protein product [Phytophthora fragariaefolia]|uniref:Unnamed protein product n=1 Tax=Phytophthora fragariaefolia TaxID=1490495 RepID=A0A9W7CVV3_9STRA|nr:unnamed protein product [Phytophthora fragariaefolia]
MELVSSELKRRRPDGSDQDKGNGEKAYAAVEGKPVGAIVGRKYVACKKAGHLVADCPEDPNRGEKVNTFEPLTKKQNTGKQHNKKDSKRTDHSDRGHKGYEADVVTTVVLSHVDIQVVSGQWCSRRRSWSSRLRWTWRPAGPTCWLPTTITPLWQ